MMATAKPLKSILKRPPAIDNTQPRTKEERDREVALYHAQLIQHRKDIELKILFSMEEMIELPLEQSYPYSASNPAPSDVALFKEAIRLFQPNDYDDLITERNINEHCGYTLCPRPRLKQEGMKNGMFRIIGKSGRAKDLRFVEKEELEKWCSEDCAKMALFVRVQLSERPAWERGASALRIELLNEEQSTEARRQQLLAEELQQLQLADRADKLDLALERGDRGSRADHGLVDVHIKEKQVLTAAEAPTLGDGALEDRFAHLELDGHTPRFGRQLPMGLEDNDEDMDTDWQRDI